MKEKEKSLEIVRTVCEQLEARQIPVERGRKDDHPFPADPRAELGAQAPRPGAGAPEKTELCKSRAQLPPRRAEAPMQQEGEKAPEKASGTQESVRVDQPP